MRRIPIVERGDWRAQAAEAGFRFHTVDGAAYWDESAYYAFTLRQIEQDLEDPSAELHRMALSLVDEVVASEALMEKLAIPEPFRDWIAESWRQRQPHLYGRLDLAYDGRGPAKLYELNYDTPTSLFEAAFFQWQWLEDQRLAGRLPAAADQFNALHEALVERFAQIAGQLPPPLYFSAVRDAEEDQGTIAYLRDCAAQAGLHGEALAIEDIGLSEDGRYTDLDDGVIGSLFKLYPLEDLFAAPFGSALPGSGLRLLEPPWKAVLSNKGILPLLWERHRGHPNLLEAEFDRGEALPAGWVRKPLYSREGANIEMHLGGARAGCAATDRTAVPASASACTRCRASRAVIPWWAAGSSATAPAASACARTRARSPATAPASCRTPSSRKARRRASMPESSRSLEAACLRCRDDCGACCIAPSIVSALPGMPQGKPASVPCVQLDAQMRCRVFGQPERPGFCGRLKAAPDMCGQSREQALALLAALEVATRP